MNKKLLFLLQMLVCVQLNAQLTPTNKEQLSKEENILKNYARDIVFAAEAVDRYRADSFFTRGLVRALRTPYSFYYNFDSLNTIAQIYAPDSTFKIFTWQLTKDYSSLRQKGAIQINTQDGSLKIIPLFDASDDTENPVDSIRDNTRWIGALYYKIILTQYNNKKYYTLFGIDDNNEKSNKKWIEVLTFKADGSPQFGGRYFQYPNDEIKPKQPAYRFCIEYKKEAGAKVTFDNDLNIIIFEHLVSETKEPEQKHTLVPDGDYEGFRWVDGRWVHINKVFDYVQDMTGVDPLIGNPPVPAPLKEEKEKKKKRKSKSEDD